jgi:hypothetical protein
MHYDGKSLEKRTTNLQRTVRFWLWLKAVWRFSTFPFDHPRPLCQSMETKNMYLEWIQRNPNKQNLITSYRLLRETAMKLLGEHAQVVIYSTNLH